MLTLQHLYIIEKITSEGSVTKAAEKLNLTQSALSHQIRDLETASGVRLFNRIGKKLVLNEAGQRVVASSQKVLPVIRELEAELKEMREGRKQTIRISTECYTCYHWLPKLLTDFYQDYPGIDIQIVAEATRKPIEYLEAGKLELALVNGTNNNASLHFEPLFEDRMVALLPDQHPLALRNIALEFADINPETLVTFQAGTESNLLSEDLVSNLSPKKIIHIPMTEAIVEMVRFGMGITVMAEWAVRQYLGRGGLVVLPFRSDISTRRWYACTHKDRSEPLSQLVGRIQTALLGTQDPVALA